MSQTKVTLIGLYVQLIFAVASPKLAGFTLWNELSEDNGVRQELKFQMMLRHNSHLFFPLNGNVDLGL